MSAPENFSLDLGMVSLLSMQTAADVRPEGWA